MDKTRKKEKKIPAAGFAPLSPADEQVLQEQLATLRQVLASDENPDGLAALVTPRPTDPSWDCRLIAELSKISHPAIPALLAQIFGASPDKVRRKAVKRALYALQSRGMAIPAELWPREPASQVRPPEDEAIKAFVTPVHGNGERFVVLETKRSVLGGTLMIARLSDVSGLVECNVYDIGRKDRENFWEAMRREGIEAWVSVSPDYAVGLLEESYALPQEKTEAFLTYQVIRERVLHFSQPRSFSEVRSMLPPLGVAQRPSLLEKCADLAGEDLFLSWMPPLKDLPPWLAKLEEVENSPLVLPEVVKNERLEKVISEATATFFPPESRPLWGRRLLHMAYYLDLKGQGDKARLAQAAGEDLLDRPFTNLTVEPPFFKELLWQAFILTGQLMDDMHEASQRRGQLIIPSEPLLIR